MRHVVALLAALLLFPSLGHAEGLDNQKAGELQAQMEEKEAAIRKEYGNPDPKAARSSLSREEQKEMNGKMAAARHEVLEKNGVTEGDYTRSATRMGKEAHKEVDASKQAYKEKTATENAAKAAAAKQEVKPIEVQRGFSDKNPVNLEGSNKEGGVAVDRGARGADLGKEASAPPPAAPAKK